VNVTTVQLKLIIAFDQEMMLGDRRAGAGNLAVVKQLLGREDITSTMRYTYTADADVLAALGHKPTTQKPARGKKPLNIKAI
jgi:hypothetical protein